MKKYSKLVKLAGVVGGVCLLFQAAIRQYDAAGAAADALFWGGLALIAVALVGLGASLVSGAPWLRLLVGLCVPVLVFAVLSALRGDSGSGVVDGGFGLLLALACAASLLGGNAISDDATRGGSHK